MEEPTTPPPRPLVPRPKHLQPSPTRSVVPYPGTHPALISPTPTTPRSILKTSDTTLVGSEASGSSGSSLKRQKSHRDKIAERGNMMIQQEHSGERIGPGRKVKDGAFFAFVLLPLSCWYTRGGKRLRALDEDEFGGGLPPNRVEMRRNGEGSIHRSQTSASIPRTVRIR